MRGHGSISPLGHTKEHIVQQYLSGEPAFGSFEGARVGVLGSEAASAIEQITNEKRIYKGLDPSVLMAIYACREAVSQAGWKTEDDIAINLGSSRGATSLFEKHLTEFLSTGSVSPNTSPVTTLGNISSWAAQDLGLGGPAISHSVTCSTGIQAIGNAFAWLKSSMVSKFLAGASEAPLTAFTLAQMNALGIYSKDFNSPYPCRPLNAARENTFVLGEAAAVFALEKVTEAELKSRNIEPVVLESVGFGFERIGSKTGISKDGQHFKLAMHNALSQAVSAAPVDMIIMHAPGTATGDMAELNAIQEVFRADEIPVLTSTKWLTGHTFAASGCLSLDYAIHVLKTQSLLDFPYPSLVNDSVKNKAINKILINSAGFGGNAASLIVSRGLNYQVL